MASFVWAVARELVGGSERAVRVIDPAAGAGVFLEVVRDDGGALRHVVRGIEVDRRLAELMPPWAAACVEWGDGLLDRFDQVQEGSFDVVVGNPPFGRLRHLHPWAHDAARWLRYSIWQRQTGRSRQARVVSPAACPIELLFVERALQLVAPGGIVGLIMPNGFLANARLQWARDWIVRQACVRAVVSLPPAAFRGPGVNAWAAAVFIERPIPGGGQPRPARLVDASASSLVDAAWAELAAAVVLGRAAPEACPATDLGAESLAGRRWDPGYWVGCSGGVGGPSPWRWLTLGDHIRHLTYGPIVTGRRPERVEGGIPVIRQGDLLASGVHLGQDATRVAPDSVYDPEHSRVQAGDLLLARSGLGALGRARMGVWVDGERANVTCFVDVIRLSGLNPFYVWCYLQTEAGRQQLRRLSSGVGTPNISFGEIRSLLIPALARDQQEAVERRYRTEVLPLHRRRSASPAAGRVADSRFRSLVLWVGEMVGSGGAGQAGEASPPAC